MVLKKEEEGVWGTSETNTIAVDTDSVRDCSASSEGDRMTSSSSDMVRGKLKEGMEAHRAMNDGRYGVREEVRSYMHTGKEDLSFGMVEDRLVKSHWFLGNAGRCEWIITKGTPQMRKRGDPEYIPSGKDVLIETLDRKSVDVVFFGGGRPPGDPRLWQNKNLKGVVWIAKRRASGAQRVPRGWKMLCKRVSHCTVGGVTNVSFWIGVALRNEGGLCWKPQTQFVGNVLRQVVDPTVGGRTCLPVKESVRRKENTALGLLDWKDRFGYVSVPTVYSKDRWARRKLKAKELCDALDLPGFLVCDASEREKELMTQVVIPGKILQFVFQGVKLERDVQILKRDHYKKRRIIELAPVSNKRPKNIVSEVESSEPVHQEEDNPRSEGKSTVTDKAVKSDDAEIPEHLWNLKVLEGIPRCQDKYASDPKYRRRFLSSVGVLRSWLLTEWKKRVERSFHVWFHGTEHMWDKREDLWKKGEEAIRRAHRASWWKWNGGSSIFFWRWPKPYQKDAEQGAKARLDAEPPVFWQAQPPLDSEKKRKMVEPKVAKVLQNGYAKIVDPGALRSLLFMFDVPKGSDDIRLVYDGSKSGLNDCLWAPWFALPTVETMCRTLEPGYWCADNDYGDQFLNFPLDRDLQKYCGIDLSRLYPNKAAKTVDLLTAMWTRNAMGLKTSPYASVQGALRAKRVMMDDSVGIGVGDKNPFSWATIRKNYPGSENYDPSLPWISKLDEEGRLASDLHQYVDDLRITAREASMAWKASSRVAKICSFLGLQDAARKRRAPSQEPGAWAGAVVSTTDGVVQKSVTQERWDKAKRKIQWLAFYAGCDMSKTKAMEGVFDDEKEMGIGIPPKGCISHKLAEKYRGFLVYVSRTYQSMVPFLKGLHLTIDAWRGDRDEDGWRITNTVERKFEFWGKNDKPGKYVPMAGRFKEDMEALLHLTRHDHPPKIPVRPTKSLAAYLVGDASGSGYGATLWGQGSNSFVATHGSWTKELSESSSNEREAYNLILNVEAALRNGDIEKGTELFVFTDNMVSERCFHSGRSKSKGLHALIMKMHDLVMQGEIFAHFVWISGERMKKQGGDGLSRGDLNTGVLQGDDYLSHIPLAEDAFKRHAPLKSWLKDALPGDNWEFLTEEDWYRKAFQDPRGKYVWSPAPCVADVCLEQLCEVKHVHPDSSHVFVCPAIMTYNWRKQLNKLSDSMTNVKQGSPIWPVDMLEPVTISLISPLLSDRPWKMQRTGFVAEWESDMQGVYSNCAETAGSYLREFWTKSWSW